MSLPHHSAGNNLIRLGISMTLWPYSGRLLFRLLADSNPWYLLPISQLPATTDAAIDVDTLLTANGELAL